MVRKEYRLITINQFTSGVGKNQPILLRLFPQRQTCRWWLVEKILLRSPPRDNTCKGMGAVGKVYLWCSNTRGLSCFTQKVWSWKLSHFEARGQTFITSHWPVIGWELSPGRERDILRTCLRWSGSHQMTTISREFWSWSQHAMSLAVGVAVQGIEYAIQSTAPGKFKSWNIASFFHIS